MRSLAINTSILAVALVIVLVVLVLTKP